MSLTWVELWGFEPQTSCIPFAPVPSGQIERRLVSAVQAGWSVWGGLAGPAVACVRSHLLARPLAGQLGGGVARVISVMMILVICSA